MRKRMTNRKQKHKHPNQIYLATQLYMHAQWARGSAAAVEATVAASTSLSSECPGCLLSWGRVGVLLASVAVLVLARWPAWCLLGCVAALGGGGRVAAVALVAVRFALLPLSALPLLILLLRQLQLAQLHIQPLLPLSLSLLVPVWLALALLWLL